MDGLIHTPNRSQMHVSTSTNLVKVAWAARQLRQQLREEKQRVSKKARTIVTTGRKRTTEDSIKPLRLLVPVALIQKVFDEGEQAAMTDGALEAVLETEEGGGGTAGGVEEPVGNEERVKGGNGDQEDDVEGLRDVGTGQLVDDADVDQVDVNEGMVATLDVASRAVNRMSLEFLLNAE